ncbi:unnamed protein product [Cuscuta campestris]|uniref:Uncharacterized protein n=1 Tax=Cuscuta campestris TaxID=132261 RepID=A0A484LSE2_9ASTE|nr:unnamed protein product [Cuscuta campestris]
MDATTESCVGNGSSKLGREEIQDAIAKAAELRALHAALVQSGGSPASLRFSTASSPHPLPHFSAQDYPVFTPSYDEEGPLPGYKHIQLENNVNYAETCDEYSVGGGKGTGSGNNLVRGPPILSELQNFRTNMLGAIKILIDTPPSAPNLVSTVVEKHTEAHGQASKEESNVDSQVGDEVDIGPETINRDDGRSNVVETNEGPLAANVAHVDKPDSTFHEFYTSVGWVISKYDVPKSVDKVVDANESPNSFAEKSVVHGAAELRKIGKNPCNVVVPPSDSSAQPQQPKNKGLIFSWLRKKIMNEFSPLRTTSESEDIGLASIEALKKEVMAANEDRDAALMEVAEMKASIGEIRGKLEYLEKYCGELKQALRLAIQPSKEDSPVKQINKSLPRIVEGGNSMPVSEEVMLEGFLQVVSEARQLVKQFCETLISHTTTVETNNDNDSLTDNLNLLLQPYRMTLHSKYSKVVLYHLEGIINQTLYEDYENCSF